MAKKKKATEEENIVSSKSTNTAFILMFPALILAGMAALYSATILGGLLAVSLAIYQFLMLKKFIENYYGER